MRPLILALAVTCATIAHAAPIEPVDVRVIDGDTIRVYHKQPNMRLVGFNAPETRRAACAAERELGDKATRRVRDLVRAGDLDFQFVACSCPAGTEDRVENVYAHGIASGTVIGNSGSQNIYNGGVASLQLWATLRNAKGVRATLAKS
jgi:autotransporter passenger strand-loop-strand repeat protein